MPACDVNVPTLNNGRFSVVCGCAKADIATAI